MINLCGCGMGEFRCEKFRLRLVGILMSNFNDQSDCKFRFRLPVARLEEHKIVLLGCKKLVTQ